MKNMIGKSWRDAATLIVLTKRNGELLSRCGDRGGVNYDVLLQTRTRSASFANSIVFPGGVWEPADGSERWLHLLKSFGYTQQDFDTLHCPGTFTPPLFQNNPIQRHIELRITAIRETFEELGVLLCSRQHKQDRSSGWASILTDIDVKQWQERLNRNPGELVTLCEEHACYPDIWALHYWSNWLTPARLPKRFDTAFFVTALEDKPASIENTSEVANVEWCSPGEVLTNTSLLLYPPQAYELYRLSHVTDVDELITFAKDRSCHSNELLYPVSLKADNGLIQILPGDDLYPSSVDYNATAVAKVGKSVSQLRDGCQSLHRFESTNLKDRIFDFVLKNYKPNHHINMGDKFIRARVTV